MSDSEMRMNAYYYGFDATGDRAIDTILSAVAWAGKAVHHTEYWTDEAYEGEPPDEALRGKTPTEWIQNAADDAAKERVDASAERLARLAHATSERIAFDDGLSEKLRNGRDEPTPWDELSEEYRRTLIEECRKTLLPGGAP